MSEDMAMSSLLDSSAPAWKTRESDRFVYKDLYHVEIATYSKTIMPKT